MGAQSAEAARLRRHLAALLRKNVLLKRRHPCSFFCELFVAIASTGLLAAARWLARDKKSFEIPAQSHVDNSLPVRLPECAEYVEECSAELVAEEPHSPICVKGVTFGCKPARKGSALEGVPSVWVSMGCNGTFNMGEGKQPIRCASTRLGRRRVCHALRKGEAAPTCDLPAEDKKDCGWPGITRGECEARSCCYIENHPTWLRRNFGPHLNVPWCFWPRQQTAQPRRLEEDDEGMSQVPQHGEEDSPQTPARPVYAEDDGMPPRQGHGEDGPPQGGGFGGAQGSMLSALMGGGASSDMRRLQAQFAIAPASHGGREFYDWLKAIGHPWARSARLYASAEAVQAHVSASDYPVRDMKTNRSSLLCGAVIFETPPNSSVVRYTLRFNATLGNEQGSSVLKRLLLSMTIKTDALIDKKEEQSPGGFSSTGVSWYTQSGFLAMQRTVDGFLADFGRPEAKPQGAEMQDGGTLSSGLASSLLGEDGRPHVIVPFPTARWQRDIFAMYMPQLLASFLLTSLAYSVNRMITSIVHEREARLRDGMRMMGMHPVSFYLSWIATYMGINTFVALGVTGLLSAGKILPHSSISLLLVWLLLFAAASISYALLISTFFTKSKTAATVGSTLFYAGSFLSNLAQPTSSPAFLRVISLLPPVAFELSAKVLADLESQGVGIGWTNIRITSQHYSVLDGCAMLALDALVLLILFLYFDQVAPREVGLQRPWYFPLQPSFWSSLCCGGRRQLPATSAVPARDPEAQDGSALIERDLGEAAAMMARLSQTVELRGLSKSFGEVQAVKALDLVMFQGEIFALLGHNGAGKTTTLAVLCGLMPPSSGACVVFGHDLTQDAADVQKLLGVCPQHDVLWEELTCEEHLVLFARFKGVEPAKVQAEVASILQRVGLQGAGATATRAGRLSGGMKRKLSLGIAFLGGSRLVVLDEPTSGLDPYSRRMVWELLRAMKQGRVTILSTHYMDEADILGDRIAILHEGSLRCSGSPTFLKRAYDCGYNVTLVKRAGCVTDTVREAICRHMPELASEVIALSDSANELILQFPFAAARHFPQVLGGLEQQMAELNVESYGVSVTTLEEVFLKVASGERVERGGPGTSRSASARGGADQEHQDEYIELQEVPLSTDSEAERPGAAGTPATGERLAGKHPMWGDGRTIVRNDDSVDEPPKPLGCALSACCTFGQHLRVLLLKRWRYGFRDRRGFLCQLLLPSGTLVLLLMLVSHRLFRSMPSLALDALDYNRHCSGTPQNLVDFTYLNAVGAADAEALLRPGRAAWNGDIRRFDPDPEDNATRMKEAALTSAVPGFLKNVLRPAIQKTLQEAREKAAAASVRGEGLPGAIEAAASGRRLQGGPVRGSGTEALEDHIEHQLVIPMLGLWASGVRIRHALREHFPTWISEASEAQEQGRRLQPAGGDRLPRWDSCIGASMYETDFWDSADKNHDGRLDEQEATAALQGLTGKLAGGRPGAGPGAQLASQLAAVGINVSVSADDRAQEEMSALATKAFVAALDTDHDGYLSEGEFCRIGAEVRKEIHHVYNLAQRFSDQILNATSECTRYGAYYVIQAARTNKSASWMVGSDAVIFVNTSSSHAAGVFQAALTNARLARLGLNKKVAVAIHPFPQTQDEQRNLEKVAVFLLAIYITFCLSFIPAGIASFVVKERECGAQQLQILSGASHLTYWLANLLYDVTLYVVPALCVPAALQQFGFSMILAGDCGWALAAVLAVFGPAVAGFAYLMSFLFKDHSKASNAILTFCLVGASVLSLVLFILAVRNFNPTYTYPLACERPTKGYPEGNCAVPLARKADRILGPIFRLVPTVCLYQALFAIAMVANLQALMPAGALEAAMSALGEEAPKISMSPFAYEWAGEPLQFLAVEAVTFFMVAALVDVGMRSPRLAGLVDAAVWVRRPGNWLRLLRGSQEARSSPLLDGEAPAGEVGDSSVELERERTALVTPQDAALHVWQLHKTYRPWLSIRGGKQAVRGVSFCVHAGEVFGLLGHNGAGKTSALKCIVGEGNCTDGAIHVGGHNMESDTGRARRAIGYCPQFDALLELLTVKDHLELFLSLKGLPREAVGQALQDFRLERMAGRRADLLSGGNKRKLSAAIALAGSPSLAILDEPSCGLDPAARRALWGAVHSAVAGAAALPRAGRPNVRPSAVLLTTHSMEEAEALSTRLGIMADGKLLTVGTSQQIKQRHGACHELRISLQQESEEALASALHQLGGGSLRPETALSFASIGPLIEADPAKKRAYNRARCVVRAQIEAVGHVEASVLAEWWLQQSRGEAIEAFLRGVAGEGVDLVENFGPYWRFRLPHGGAPLPELFRRMEDTGKRLGIAEYTLSQATLEQIFNSIAGEAEEERQASGA